MSSFLHVYNTARKATVEYHKAIEVMQTAGISFTAASTNKTIYLRKPTNRHRYIDVDQLDSLRGSTLCNKVWVDELVSWEHRAQAKLLETPRYDCHTGADDTPDPEDPQCNNS
jgi:hypothetical protein